MSKPIIGIVVVALALAGIYFVMKMKAPVQMDSITTFEECKAAGYPIMESFPEQCRTPDGRTFVRPVGPTPQTNPQPVACTMEAKLCPDGSYVGRTGPRCEFAPCPTSKPVVCTMDAKLCPDGSFVGRTGPRCEFSACPGPIRAIQ